MNPNDGPNYYNYDYFPPTATRRDKKRNKRKYGMKIDGRSIFTIVGAMRKRAQKRRWRDIEDDWKQDSRGG